MNPKPEDLVPRVLMPVAVMDAEFEVEQILDHRKKPGARAAAAAVACLACIEHALSRVSIAQRLTRHACTADVFAERKWEYQVRVSSAMERVRPQR